MEWMLGIVGVLVVCYFVWASKEVRELRAQVVAMRAVLPPESVPAARARMFDVLLERGLPSDAAAQAAREAFDG